MAQIIELQPQSVITPSVITVSREQIRAITSVEINGELHTLGQQRDFRRNEALAKFLPDDCRPSFAWVRLRNGETLSNHEHPTSSMIIVCNGSVQLTGDAPRRLIEGDIVCVPPHSKHGFTTAPNETFHGLSIQFEGAGLYENEHIPRVNFGSQLTGLNQLNDELLKKHVNNSLFKLFASGRLQKEPELRARFVSALYVWSSHFQRMIHARQALCIDNNLREDYNQHFCEEYGHDRLLRERYQIKNDVYDPILEASCSWFVTQMHRLDEPRKIVLVHYVVESSGHAFGLATADIFRDTAAKGDYFEVHAEADDDHRMIGREYLETVPASALPGLMDTCRRSWDQMNLIHDRIAAWTLAKE